MFGTGKLGRIYDKVRRTDKEPRHAEADTTNHSADRYNDALHNERRPTPWTSQASSSTTSLDRIGLLYGDGRLEGSNRPASDGSGETTPRKSTFSTSTLKAPVLPPLRPLASPIKFPMPHGPSQDVSIALSDDDEEFAAECTDLPMALATTARHRRGGYTQATHHETGGRGNDACEPAWDSLSSVQSESTSSSMDISLRRSMSGTGTSVSSRSASTNDKGRVSKRSRLHGCQIQQDYFLQRLDLSPSQWSQLVWGMPQSVYVMYAKMYVNGLDALLAGRKTSMMDLALDKDVQHTLLEQAARIVATEDGIYRLTRFARWALMGQVGEPLYIHTQLNHVGALGLDELFCLLGPLQLSEAQRDALQVHGLAVLPARIRPIDIQLAHLGRPL